MKENSPVGRWHRSEKGATLYIVAASMVVLLGVSALAIDLVSFFLARAQAQRSADAGALAGASIFVSQGCTSTGGCVAGGAQEAPAKTQAIAVASQNQVAGQAPSSSTVGVSFNYPTNEEPQINVTVYRDAAHGNALPTFFGKIFGINTVDVSATAWAEAYNPSGGSTPVGTACLRPFLVPNCDPGHPVTSATDPRANPNCAALTNNPTDPDIYSRVYCPGGASTCYASYFFDPNNKNIPLNNSIYVNGTPPSGGIIGEPWQLHDNASPSQWYLLGIGTPCGLAPPNDGAALRTYISVCVPCVISCEQPLNTANGQKVGPTDQGINALINATGDGPGNGQDTICSPTTTPACATPPFPITGGSGNPNTNLVGQTFYTDSSSLISVAVYDGHTLPSGGSTVTVIAFMQLFVVDAQGPPVDGIDTVIMGVGGCGASSGSSPPVTSAGGGPVPIRLIHQ